MEELAKTLGLTIPGMGIVATKVQPNNLHRAVINDLRNKRLGHFGDGVIPQPPLFDAEIPQTVDVARGADPDSDLRTFKGKYGRASDPLKSLVQEIRSICEKIKS